MYQRDTEPPSEPESRRLLQQRDQALACAILAAILSVGMGWTNFAREYPGLRESREAVRLHRESLTEHEGLMTSVRKLLVDSRKDLEVLRQTRHHLP